jgi:DNA-binding SARP family transcriptional activator
LEFRILGPLEVVANGRPLELGRRKQRAVLAILLVHANRVVSLDRLVDELWGSDPPAQAIGSLQAYVSHLRRLLEPERSARTPAEVLVSQRPGYRLMVAGGALDASRFETLTSTGRALLEAGTYDEAASVLAEGLQLWRGPVLADFADASFVSVERARLEELQLVAEEDRAAAELALGRHTTLIAELEHLVAAHPFREGLHGLWMLALYRSGRQADALRAYQEARQVLRDELGIDPSAQLRQLEADILRQAPQLDWRPARLSPTEPVPPSPASEATELVGREAQLAALAAARAGAATGQGRLVLVSGEPGIGKTRLAAESARRATVDGVVVAWGRCSEEHGAPPLWLWVQVLRELLTGMPPESVRAVLGSEGSDLTLLAPELADVTGAVPPVPVLDVEAVRFRLCHAMITVLRRLGRSRTMMLVLDDLQWADVASLQLLSMLGRSLRGTRLLIVATFRSADADGGDGLAAALAALAREAPVDRMALGGLSVDEVGRMMSEELGATPDPELARLVHERTDGNPFFVVELLRLVGTRGQLAAAETPAGVRDVLRRRLAKLPEQTNAVLLVAAVVGRHFDLDTVTAVTGLDDDQALEAVEVALLAGLIVEDADMVGRFRFAHALVREVIYDDVSGVRRARLHARVAAALESRADDRADHALAVAHHWWLAAPVVSAETVLPHLLTGADRALSLLAHEQAEQHLRRALVLLTAKPPSRERIRSEHEVQLRLGALSAQLKGAAAEPTWAAVVRAGELADELADDAAKIAAYRSLYEVAVARAEHETAAKLAETMLVIAERSQNSAALSIAHLAMGRSLWCQGSPANAREHLQQSLRLAAEVPVVAHEPLPMVVTVQLQLAPVLDLLDAREEASALLETALGQTQNLPPLVRAGVLTSAALVTALGRDVGRARSYAAEALQLAAKLPVWSSYATAVREWTKAVDNDPGVDVALLRCSLDDIEAGGGQHLVPWGRGLLAEAEMLTGRPDEALRLLDDALSRVARSGERMYEAELHRIRGMALGAIAPPQPAEARAALELAVAVARQQGSEALARRAGAYSSSDSQPVASPSAS